MSSESVCHVARGWVNVDSFHARLVMRFMSFTASVRNILDTPSYYSVLSKMVASCTYTKLSIRNIR
jgi:hypothetical protein